MDGGEGVRRSVPQSARIDQLWPEFGNIIQYHYPGDDYSDLMIGVDELLKRGYIDPKKLGCDWWQWRRRSDRLDDHPYGSVRRGGIATRHFRLGSWWYTADFTLFQPQWFKAPPFEDPQDYAGRSAITFVKTSTPP